MPPATYTWKEAASRLRALDTAWDNATSRQEHLVACRDWMEQQTHLPRLVALARLLTPTVTRQQFWSVLVPVEREVAKQRITDIDILDADLPPEAAHPAPHLPLTVVVDSLRSAFNVGGLFRTAECFGVRELVLCGYTPLPDHPQVARAALGTELLVAWQQQEDIRVALADLQARNIPCIALETVAGAPAATAFAWRFPCALIVGNERFGIDPEIVARCDGIVRIPLFGRKNSLNVVSAFALAADAIRRAWDAVP
ncbi:MAG: TrmH family RNA methyltransferase [Clostridia bacterium]|nr:TrmH family RNA methyltransferase [Clostridia bacterium]